MYNFKKMYDTQVEAVRSGAKISTVMKKVDRADISPQAAKLLKASIIQNVTLNSAPGVIKMEMCLSDKEAALLANLAEKINEYAESEKFNLLITVLAIAECNSRTSAKKIFFYFNLFNLSDLSKNDLAAIEKSTAKDVRVTLLNSPSTVKIKCPNCGKEKYLYELTQGSYVCKECSSNGITYTGEHEPKVNLAQAVESMSHNNIDKSHGEDDAARQSAYIAEINTIKAFYNKVCSTMFSMTSEPEQLDTLLNKIRAINKIIELEV